MMQGLIRRNWRTVYALAGMGVDAAVLCGGFFVAAKIVNERFTFLDILVTHKNLLIFSLADFFTLFTAFGVYRTLSYSSFARQAFNAGKVYLSGTAVILSTLFLLRNFFYSRSFVLLYLMLVPGLYILAWTVVRMVVKTLHSKGYGRWNTLAIGSEPNLQHLIRKAEEFPELGYDIVSILEVPQGDKEGGAVHVEAGVVEEIAAEENIGLIVFTSANLNGSFEQLENLCRTRRIGMRVVSPEAEYLFSQTRLRDIAGIPLFTPERTRISRLKAIVKRAFDILGGTLTLVFLSPLFLVVAAAMKIESRGPVFFTQKRSLTDQDPPFDFYKFRSMYHTADEQKESLLHRNESSGALFKIKNDPRLTPIGRFIRRFSIDELPQLFNVIKGDMSLVGPRPLPVDDFSLLEEEDHMGGFFRQRAKAKPGMTGLWQISGRSDLGFREMVLLDMYYIENQTILFDVEILAQTIPVVLFGRGAY